MLIESDYLNILNTQPEVTFFYYDRPILYTISYNGNEYMISLTEEYDENQSERYLFIKYGKDIFNLIDRGSITPREFFIHPDNIVHNVLIKYLDNGETILLSGWQYQDNSAIPDGYLPTVDGRWK